MTTEVDPTTISDIILTDAEWQDILHYKDFDKDWAESASFSLKASKWRYRFLSCKKISRGRDSPYRCYSEGKDEWSRKDGQPLTTEDLIAIQMDSPGQGSNINGKAGDLKVVHSWFFDSSD